MQAYLFVHFKEKSTPDGEQVYFGLSTDGFHWEPVNNGNPILWCYYGDKGVRDFTIVRTKDSKKFYIIGTDLSLAYGMRNQYEQDWNKISRYGSHALCIWESEDLVNWSEQRLIQMVDDDYGCVWAPDVMYDRQSGDYMIHWSSPHKSDGYKEKAIYYSRTKDFREFSQPELLYRKEDSGVIDSAMYEENGWYYLFVKSEGNPQKNILLKSQSITGPFERILAFDESTKELESGLYEAATAVKLETGQWCLFLDFYGVVGEGQGYVPFISDSLSEGRFTRSDAVFSFPYGFKHGTILTISQEEYQRIKAAKWNR